MYGTQQVHDGCGAGAAHSEIDNGDITCRGALHGLACAYYSYFIPFGEQLHVISKIREQDVFAELLNLFPGVPG